MKSLLTPGNVSTWMGDSVCDHLLRSTQLFIPRVSAIWLGLRRAAIGGFRPGPGEAMQFCSSPFPPVSWPLMIFFARITQLSYVFVFSRFTKVSKFAASIEYPKTKSASASGGLCP